MKNVYSVGQVNTYIKNMFAQDFMMQRISVKGEVSNCKYHSVKGRCGDDRRDYVCGEPQRSCIPDEGRGQGDRDRLHRSI